jgi:hypothetical protein
LSRRDQEKKIDEAIRDLPKLNTFLSTSDRNRGMEREIREGIAIAWKIRERIAKATKEAHVSAHDLILAMEEMADLILEWDEKLRLMSGIVFRDHVHGSVSEIRRRIEKGENDSCPFRL